ncbi:MAG: hypothetical protein ACLPUG_09700 [Acidimicrobiales bacterium]|jgi:hypothetical protein
MRRRRRAGVLAGALVPGTLLVVGVLAVSGSSATAPTAPKSAPRVLTGAYQLYCPDPVETPIVLHVRARATISPDAPALRGRFKVSGFQTEVTFPQGVASALAQMSPITGNVRGTVLVVGATPTTQRVSESFVANIPAAVPAAGFNFWVPARPVSLGAFKADTLSIAVEEASRFRLTLEVGQGTQAQTRVLACTAFANNTPDFQPAQPWVGTKEPPFADAITPVIALGR